MKTFILLFTIATFSQGCLGQSKTQKQETKKDNIGFVIVDDNVAFSHPDNLVSMSVVPKNLQGFKVYKTISEAIKSPKDVYALDLSSQSLTKVPEEIKTLTNLKS